MKINRTPLRICILSAIMIVGTLGLLAQVKKTGIGEAEGEAVETATGTEAQVKETPVQRDARMAWWREAKFGLFIHWGIYSVPAGSYGGKDTYGEWIMHQTRMPVAEYRRIAEQFNPVKYSPDAWVSTAKEAGMRYIVITSKHHDGFALFPSAASDWNVAKATPYKKDLLAPLVAAARHEGVKIGFYYSQAQDWVNKGGAKSRFKEEEGGWDEAHKGSFDAYLQNVAMPQVRELLTRYQPDILWWDTPTWMDSKRTAPFGALVKLYPRMITNNRLGGGFQGDTATPEQFVPMTGYNGDWETCMTMNDHWGFNRNDHHWKSTAELIRKLATICSKGGNFLLNIGPTADGEFPPESVTRLKEIGQWLGKNGDAIYGTKAGPFTYLSWGCATRKGNNLYLHVFKLPADGRLRVPLTSSVRDAWLLTAPDRKLKVVREASRVIVSLPAAAPDVIDSVVVLELDGEPAVTPIPSVGATAQASSERKGDEARNALDGSGKKVWRAPDDVKSAWIEIDLGRPQAIAGIGLDGLDIWPRRKQSLKLEYFDGSVWKLLVEGKTDGHGFVGNFTAVTAQKFRLTADCEVGGPGAAEIQLYGVE